MHLFNAVIELVIATQLAFALVGMIQVQKLVSHQTCQMSKVGAERDILQALIHRFLVEFEDSKSNYSDRISNHHFWMIIELDGSSKQGEVVNSLR